MLEVGPREGEVSCDIIAVLKPAQCAPLLGIADRLGRSNAVCRELHSIQQGASCLTGVRPAVVEAAQERQAPEVLDREVPLGTLDTIEDIAPAVDLGDMHRWRELAAPPFVEVNIAEELGQKGLTLGDDAVISEQIFRIIRGEDLRRGSVAKIQTIPAHCLEREKPFALSRVFLLFSGGKSALLVKVKAPSRSGISLSTHVVLKTRYVNPNIHVRRY